VLMTGESYSVTKRNRKSPDISKPAKENGCAYMFFPFPTCGGADAHPCRTGFCLSHRMIDVDRTSATALIAATDPTRTRLVARPNVIRTTSAPSAVLLALSPREIQLSMCSKSNER